MPKLCALICYYPDQIPTATTTPPQGLKVMVHFAGSQLFGMSCKSYVYEGTEPGFAGVDFETYDRVAAGLAW